VGAIGRRPERRMLKATGVSTDSRGVRAGEIFFALTGRRCDGHDFVRDALARGAAAAVVSRSVSVDPADRERVIRVADTLRALGDSARAYRRAWRGVVVAVTGSNGKTTTREMIHHILRDSVPCKRSPKSFNTDVGVPLTLFLADAEDKALIVEMGTNAPGEIAHLTDVAEPDMGLVTNVGESHLEGLGSLDGVAHEKGGLLEALPSSGTAFLNADDPLCGFLRMRANCAVETFGLGRESDIRGMDVKPTARGHDFTVSGDARASLRVPGLHNVRNALGALAVARRLGIPLRDAAERLADFRLPDLRCQVERIRGVTVVADCYNANPVSMRAALETFRAMATVGRRAAVFGDMLELGDKSVRFHEVLGSQAAGNVDALWAVGRYADSVVESARAQGLKGPARAATELGEIADEILDYLRPGDALLVKGSRGMRLEELVERFRAQRPVAAGRV